MKIIIKNTVLHIKFSADIDPRDHHITRLEEFYVLISPFTKIHAWNCENAVSFLPQIKLDQFSLEVIRGSFQFTTKKFNIFAT